MQDKPLPRLLCVRDIQQHYIHDISYRKLKCFLLSYIPYQKIGRQYFFSKKKLEQLIEAEDSAVFQLQKEDYGYKNKK